MVNLIECTCKKCGATLDFDLDKAQLFCPYCGSKLTFDIDSKEYVDYLKEKEETKRYKIATETNFKEHKLRSKETIILLGFLILIMILSFIFESIAK